MKDTDLTIASNQTCSILPVATATCVSFSSDCDLLQSYQASLQFVDHFNMDDKRNVFTSPTIACPIIKNFFSLANNSERTRHRSITSPSIRFDLNRGFNDFREEPRGHLALISPLVPYVTSKDAVVTWRSVLTRLACTPICTREEYTLIIERTPRARLYIVEWKEEAELQRAGSVSELQRKQCYWGRSFEAWMTKDREGHHTPNSIEYDVVMRVSIPNTAPHAHPLQVLFGAEIDGKLDDNDEWVELKTCDVKHQQMFYNHNYCTSYVHDKQAKWWAQSHLVGIKTLVVGFRDSKGTVKQLEQMSVERHLNVVTKEEKGRMLGFLFTALEWIHSETTSLTTASSESQYFVVEYKPESKNLVLGRLSQHINLK